MRRGFTLAELLIALALTALAIAIMSEGVRRTIEFQERLETVRNERDTLLAVAGAIRSRIEHLVPAVRPGDPADASPQALFSGDARSMTFIAADPGYPSRAGLYEYRLELIATDDDTNNGNTGVLRLSRRPIANLADFSAATGTAFQSWDLPLPGELAFRYGRSPSQLQPDWTEAAGFPGFVAMVSETADLPVMLTSLPRQAPAQDPDMEARQ
ncbi:prepilin-type N-terminal cleavage/methylation domain-containing protein [Hyphobacterium sp.]|uniref:prepilin-type N-terminal cleavage/methylation domain-containing protein n=1 Tax=Hyphobacterium sp. TaxID=2004662 RepID=UPI003B5204F1